MTRLMLFRRAVGPTSLSSIAQDLVVGAEANKDMQLYCFFDACRIRLVMQVPVTDAGAHLTVALWRPSRSGQGLTVNGRIMSLSSCSRMWQW
jgi:hypothetical protein